MRFPDRPVGPLAFSAGEDLETARPFEFLAPMLAGFAGRTAGQHPASLTFLLPVMPSAEACPKRTLPFEKLPQL